MNYNIEWLFEEVYEIKKDIHRSAPYFISDWDVVGEEVAGFKALLKEIFSTTSWNMWARLNEWMMNNENLFEH